MSLSAEHLHIIQHSLGCDQFGQSEHRRRDEGDGCFGYYRNRYVSDATSDLLALCSAGLMKDHGPQTLAGGMRCYCVTPVGIEVMIAESPKPPKLSRSQRRWQHYRKVADCFESFRHFLAYEKHHREGNRP
jgi:hypothetical protein